MQYVLRTFVVMFRLNDFLGVDRPLILASASPRRRHLLTHIGLDFQVVVADVNEDTVSTSTPPDEYVSVLATLKARTVAEAQSLPAYVIGSDTTVVLDGEILNKPASEAEARGMLRKLSNRTHTVFTAIAIVDSASMRTITAVRNTNVEFRELDDLEIDAYVATGSPMDKAGAYGIQDDFGAVFVRKVDGCYYTIVGLPLELLYTTLKTFVTEAT